jgi:hypothetical protein
MEFIHGNIEVFSFPKAGDIARILRLLRHPGFRA